MSIEKIRDKITERKRMFLLFIKKLLGFKSPSIHMLTGGKYLYEYDYFKDKYRKEVK